MVIVQCTRESGCYEKIIPYSLMLFIPCTRPMDMCIMEANPAEAFFVLVVLPTYNSFYILYLQIKMTL